MSNSQPRVVRTPQDLKRALIEQVTLLMAYCEHFDRGELEFSKPMATCVRVLLHQSRSSHSLLQQLGLRSGRYFSVAPPLNPRNLLSECNLLVVKLSSNNVEYVPQFEPPFKGNYRRPFPEWWTAPVAKSQEKKTMSRLDIVVSVAEMDGGAHVDPALTPLYEAFRNGTFLGWMVSIDGAEAKNLRSPQYACIRAIAHELLLSLQQYAPWSLRKPYQYVGNFQST